MWTTGGELERFLPGVGANQKVASDGVERAAGGWGPLAFDRTAQQPPATLELAGADQAVPTDDEADDEQLQQELAQQRTRILNHAYGFASRDNRAGGLEHIYRWLDNDPEPATAWPWFLDHMLRWENTDPALHYAQHYLKQLLVNGDRISAVKLMLRCQLIDPSFRPQADDLSLAIAAAEQCGNKELAGALNR